jgi:hypothetical protein
MDSISAVTLTDRELADHLEEATQRITSFSFRAPRAEEREESAAKTATLRGRRVAYRPLQSPSAEPAAENEFSLVERIQQIVPQDRLFTDVEHHVLWVLRRAIQVYAQIYRAYEQASGLDRLKAANQAGTLGAHDEPELQEKIQAASAAALFAMNGYALAQLLEYQRDATEALSFEVDPPGELPLEGRAKTLDAGLHHFYRAIDARARDDASLVKAVRDAARAMAERVRTLHRSLQYLEFYTRYHYRVEPEGVRIAGFELPEPSMGTEIQVPVRRPEQVVGNHLAKLLATRIAQRLACYDPERQSNPFVELGGFIFTFIGDGSPGTGKTTLIQMMVTLLREYTRVAGVPLRYQNFSVDEISDYQGRSGQNAKRFCSSILDPRVIGFGTIDDVDQVCGNRNDRNASAGQLEVTGVFMQQFAGADTVVRGNASFGLFSNHPERVDDALRQRMQGRLPVDGPRTREDFSDLLQILLSKSFELPPGDGYQPFATQQVRAMISSKYAEHDAPAAAALRAIFRGQGELASWRDFGEYLHALMQHDGRFTGRAVKNIADAVLSRMMDFDLPAEWLEKREAFFARPYETRVQMISELRVPITTDMVIQEINRYADSEARYAEVAERRALEERTRQLELEARARRAVVDREP